VFDFKRKKFN